MTPERLGRGLGAQKSAPDTARRSAVVREVKASKERESAVNDISVDEDSRKRRVPVPITIDRRPYEAPENPMTGAQLRQLAKPPIGADRNLYVDKHGTDGVLIGDSEEVELHPGMVFFSVPKKINEG